MRKKTKIHVTKDDGFWEFDSLIDAATTLNTGLHKPNFARLVAWAEKNGYNISIDPVKDEYAPVVGADNDEPTTEANPIELTDFEKMIANQFDDGDSQDGQGNDNNKYVTHPELQKAAKSIIGHVDGEIASLAAANKAIRGRLLEIETQKKNGFDVEKMRNAIIEPMKALDAKIEAVAKNSGAAKPVTVVLKKVGKETKIEGQHKDFPLLLKAISTMFPIFLVGPAGSGKTTAVENCAKALELDYYATSVGEQTTLSHLLGFIDANGRYHTTQFRQAFQKGGVFLLDEIDNGNSNVIATLNAALSNGYMSFPDERINAHPDFVCVASGNTYGNGANRMYVGRNQLDSATLDRFIIINWDYDEILESQLTDNKEWLKVVQKARKAVENAGIRSVVSPRATIYGTRLIAAKVPMTKVRTMLITGKLSEADKKRFETAYKAL